MALAPPEALSLSDGTTVMVPQLPGTTAEEWATTKKYLLENPDEARKMEAFMKDAAGVRKWQQQQALWEHYQGRIAGGDEYVTNKIMGLPANFEFAPIFDEVRKSGVIAALAHSNNEPLLVKVSRAVGGIPDDMKEFMTKSATTPVNLHDACKMGLTQAVTDYIAAGGALDTPDSKGIMPLGYAIGANRVAIVKALVEKGADASKCDTHGNTAVHIAAAYGRKDLLSFLLGAGQNANARNEGGQTPLTLATKNKMLEAVDVLKAKGATE